MNSCQWSVRRVACSAILLDIGQKDNMFGILAYSLERTSTTSTYHLYNLSRDQATFKWATLLYDKNQNRDHVNTTNFL